LSGGTILGFNVVEAEDMPVMAADSLSLAFGDFREAYQIVDRIGIRVLRDALTNKPYVGFYTTKRVGGDAINFEAVKFSPRPIPAPRLTFGASMLRRC
jgi:HK97 family phage major capsid protein